MKILIDHNEIIVVIRIWINDCADTVYYCLSTDYYPLD